MQNVGIAAVERLLLFHHAPERVLAALFVIPERLPDKLLRLKEVGDLSGQPEAAPIPSLILTLIRLIPAAQPVSVAPERRAPVSGMYEQLSGRRLKAFSGSKLKIHRRIFHKGAHRLIVLVEGVFAHFGFTLHGEHSESALLRRTEEIEELHREGGGRFLIYADAAVAERILVFREEIPAVGMVRKADTPERRKDNAAADLFHAGPCSRQRKSHR